ncbi:MAG: Ig-like domain-containing protein, partial [Candidatus Neomarinimicrobiota bacterium]
YMKKLYFLSLIFIISSCGGGGGGGGGTDPVPIPFSLTLGLLSFSVDEDQIYSGSLNASANETVTLEYLITSNPSQGSIQLASSGAITYTPKLNYYGSDQFQYSVRAVEKNITKSATVNITINSVEDAPTVSFASFNNFSEETLLFEDEQTFRLRVNDIDTAYEDLSFTLDIGGQSLSGIFTPDTEENANGSGDFTINLSTLENAGLYDASIKVSDTSTSASLFFTSWFISNKTTVTIEQDDTPEDGFDGDDKTPKDYLVYQLSGSSSSKGKTKYLFVGDSLEGESDIDLYRRALIASVNKLYSSDAADFFTDDYFTIYSAEPISPDGTSPIGVRTGCYDFDEDIYCIGEIDDDIFDVLLPNNTLVSTLTRVQGRGVNQGYKNIQKIRDTDPERTSTTLMHELGHAHGYMGDEYRTDDDRDVSQYADLNVNTSTQSDVSLLKWHHHIDDLTNVLGKDIQVCYNYSDGTIGDWDDLGITIADFDCFINEWDADGNFVRKNPDCSGVGQFEGNYYGLYDNYRPTFCSIMDSCSSGGYGKVNVEGFAVGSLQNQGFYNSADIGFARNGSNENTGWQMTLDVEYDTSKVTLKWYVNGVEDTSKQNQTDVTFNRPADNSVQIYTAKAVDLTGTITAEDDVMNHDDFYKGLFQSSFYWCADYSDGECLDWRYDPSPSEYSQFDYGYMRGPLGETWGINWAKW